MGNIEQVKSDNRAELPPIEFTNLIQRELIQNSQEDPVVWVEKNSANFRKLLEANPNLIEDYKKLSEDKDKKNRFLEFVAGALRDIRMGEGEAN